jgi:hypothetical protein
MVRTISHCFAKKVRAVNSSREVFPNDGLKYRHGRGVDDRSVYGEDSFSRIFHIVEKQAKQHWRGFSKE